MSNFAFAHQSFFEIDKYIGGKSAAEPNNPFGKVIKLSSNENPLGSSPLAQEAYLTCKSKLSFYPDGESKILREKLAEYHDLSYESLLCGAGSDEIITLLCNLFVKPGKNIIYSEYGFLMYKISTQRFGGDVLVAKEADLRCNVENIRSLVNANTNLIFIANPNNPTGSHISPAEVEWLLEHLPSHVVLVMDEAYAEYAEGIEGDWKSALDLVKDHDNLVVMRTFSKIFGLAALRVGWCHASPELIDVMDRIRNPFNLCMPAQMAAAAALDDTAFLQASREVNTSGLIQYQNFSLKTYPSIGNFVLVEFGDKASAEKHYKYLFSHGIIVRAMDSYGLPSCLRITISTEEINRYVIEQLKQVS